MVSYQPLFFKPYEDILYVVLTCHHKRSIEINYQKEKSGFMYKFIKTTVHEKIVFLQVDMILLLCIECDTYG